jgi:hypothetical protein
MMPMLIYQIESLNLNVKSSADDIKFERNRYEAKCPNYL